MYYWCGLMMTLRAFRIVSHGVSFIIQYESLSFIVEKHTP